MIYAFRNHLSCFFLLSRKARARERRNSFALSLGFDASGASEVILLGQFREKAEKNGRQGSSRRLIYLCKAGNEDGTKFSVLAREDAGTYGAYSILH